MYKACSLVKSETLGIVTESLNMGADETITQVNTITEVYIKSEENVADEYVNENENESENLQFFDVKSVSSNLTSHCDDNQLLENAAEGDEYNSIKFINSFNKDSLTSKLLKTHGYVKLDDHSYSCTLCGRAFKQFSRFKDHMLVHSSEKAFMCHICSKQFKFAKNLKSHILQNHSEKGASKKCIKPFKCLRCKRQFRYKETLLKHLQICSHKSKIANIKKELVHAEVSEDINWLPKCYVRLDRLPSSINCTDVVKASEFESLNSFNIRKDKLLADLLKKLGYIKFDDKSFCCNVCGRGFTQLCRLKDHMLVHSSEKLFKCELCHRKFKHLESRRRHTLQVHFNKKIAPIKVKLLKCLKCEQIFKQKTDLMEHIRICNQNSADIEKELHSEVIIIKGEPKNSNQIIEVSEIQPSTNVKPTEELATSESHLDFITNDKETHKNKDKVWWCEACGHRFKQFYQLTKHMLSHSNEKRFKCDLCSFEFKHSESRRRHFVQVHSNKEAISINRLKAFKCLTCKKSIQQSDFKKHSQMCNQNPNENKITTQEDNDSMTTISSLMSQALECYVKLIRLPKNIKLTDVIKVDEFNCEDLVNAFHRRKLTSELLKKHGRVKSVDKSWSCNICKRSFKECYRLKRHMLVHSSEKLYKCQLCSLEFKHSESRRRHFLQMHSNKEALNHVFNKKMVVAETLNFSSDSVSANQEVNIKQCNEEVVLIKEEFEDIGGDSCIGDSVVDKCESIFVNCSAEYEHENFDHNQDINLSFEPSNESFLREADRLQLEQ